jgi:hypothetical protein
MADAEDVGCHDLLTAKTPSAPREENEERFLGWVVVGKRIIKL